MWFCLLLFDEFSSTRHLVRSQALHGTLELKWLSSLPCGQEPHVAFEVGLGISWWAWRKKLVEQTCVPRSGGEGAGAQGMLPWWRALVDGDGRRVLAWTLSSVTLETAGVIQAPR